MEFHPKVVIFRNTYTAFPFPVAFAPRMLVLIGLGTVLVFVLGPIMNIIGLIMIIAIALYAAINPQSIFSPRTVDDRKLTFAPNELVWGNLLLLLHALENLEINIYAFANFQHGMSGPNNTKTLSSEYGDRNTLTFIYNKTNYELTFYLGTFEHYDTLVQILRMWRENGVNFTAKSMFTDSYIREQTRLFGQR